MASVLPNVASYHELRRTSLPHCSCLMTGLVQSATVEDGAPWHIPLNSGAGLHKGSWLQRTNLPTSHSVSAETAVCLVSRHAETCPLISREALFFLEELALSYEFSFLTTVVKDLEKMQSFSPHCKKSSQHSSADNSFCFWKQFCFRDNNILFYRISYLSQNSVKIHIRT